MMTALAVAGGAAIGAPCRYLLDRVVQARHVDRFPWGTLLINLLGSAVLGVVLGWSSGADGVTGSGTGSQGTELSPTVLAALGVGWCGAFTTYSTFTLETVQLVRDGFTRRAAGYVLISVLGGLGLATLGVVAGQALSR
jgi:fluoride exporter